MGSWLLFGFILQLDPPADKFSLNLLISLLNRLINTYLNSLTLVTIISQMNDLYVQNNVFFFPAKISRKINMIADQKDGKRLFSHFSF